MIWQARFARVIQGDYDSIREPQFLAIVQWALASRIPDAQIVHTPPFSRNDAPEIIGTTIVFNYINRMVNVFLGNNLFALPTFLKGLTGRLFGATAGKRLVYRSLRSGDSLKFVPQALLADDLSWAASNPVVAGALAGFAKVVEEAGKEVLPEEVRLLVNEYVQRWNGEALGLGRGWVEEAIVELKEEHCSAARLVLLTALASYQVDANVVNRYRAQYPDDAQIVAATAWASFTAARRLGSWLHLPAA
jgi:hypothetical protein